MPSITGGGQPDGASHAMPMAQENHDNTPVINIPSSAVPPQLANAPHPGQAQMTEIIVDGQRQLVTHAQMVELAQKGVSSGNRYQEASVKSREAEEAIAFKSDMDLLAETGDISAFRRAGAHMGLTGDEVEEAARIVYAQMEGDDDDGEEAFDENTLYEDPPQRGGRVTPDQRIRLLELEIQKMKAGQGASTKFGDLDESLQTVVVTVEQDRVNKIIQNSLDSDEVLRYYMSSLDPKGQQAVRNMVDEKVRGRLDASDGQFGDGTRILREIIPEVREHLEALGTPSRSTPQMGLGPAPGGTGGANIYPTKEPDHVPSTESGFEEHIQETLNYNQFKANQG